MNRHLDVFLLILMLVMASASAHADGLGDAQGLDKSTCIAFQAPTVTTDKGMGQGRRVSPTGPGQTGPAANAMQQVPRASAKQGAAVNPVITISSPPIDGATITTPNLSFTITCSKPATICWRLDNGAATCSIPGATSFNAILMNLAEGNHMLNVTAVDDEGNMVSSSRVWRVDF